ncbi:MAG: nucleoside monophosphate kinase [Patescibacteria group bacterium]
MDRESRPLQVVILLGPPGAGKGTQAELLSERLNLYYLETSKILEERFANAKTEEYLEVEGAKYFLADEKKRWETGKLCSFPFVTAILKERMEKLFHEGKSLLLAGSPRSLYEGEQELPLLEKLYGKGNIHVILLHVSAEASIERNSHRRICALSRHPILYTRQTENLTICPLDGSPLQRRMGLDDPESIKVRLQEYKEHTYPLVEFFRKCGVLVKTVDGDQSPAEVFQDILEALHVA